MNHHVHPSHNPSAAQILRQSKYSPVVDSCLDVAIKAHGVALDHYLSNRDDTDSLYRTMHTLQAVVLARMPKAADCRRQIDYLTGLPREAWSLWPAGDPDTARETTLSAITRNLICRMEP